MVFVRHALVTLVMAAVMVGAGPQRSVAHSDQAVTPDDSRLTKLPPALQEQGRRILTEPEDEKRADLAEALAETDALGALDFLLALLETDSSADVREEIVDALEDVADDRVGPALERRVLSDPDIDMPAAYYTFTAGAVQFFALDTDMIAEAQLQWLTRELDRSRATWKVVYGHHPIYSAGVHEDNNTKIDQLLPVLRTRADIYLAGHDHDMQHLVPEGRLHFFVAGSGGKLRPIEPGPRSLFAKSANGFAVLEADQETLTVSFVETDLSTPYRYTLRRARPTT